MTIMYKRSVGLILLVFIIYSIISIIDSKPTTNAGILKVIRPLSLILKVDNNNNEQLKQQQQPPQPPKPPQHQQKTKQEVDYNQDVVNVLNKMKKQINKFRYVRMYQFPPMEDGDDHQSKGPTKLPTYPIYDLNIIDASLEDCYFSEDGLTKWQSRRLVNVGGYQYISQQDFNVGQNYNYIIAVNDDDPSTSSICNTIKLRIYKDFNGLLSIPEFICIDNNNNNNNDNNNIDNTQQNIDTFKVMTYNTWNYNSPWRSRSKLITDIIKDHQPDIIALQELRYSKWNGEHYKESPKLMGQERNQIQHIVNILSFHNLKYDYIYLPSMIYNNEQDGLQMEGLGILSKYPIIKTNSTKLSNDYLEDHADQHQRSCLLATIKIGDKMVNMLTSHFSLSDQGGTRNAFEVYNWSKQFNDYPSILVGDFNAEPQSNPIQFLTGKHVIEQSTGDFKDMYETFCQNNHQHQQCSTSNEDGGVTYRDVSNPSSIKKRIDYVMMKQGQGPKSPHLELINFENVGGERFDSNGSPLSLFPSDHSSLVSTFKFI